MKEREEKQDQKKQPQKSFIKPLSISAAMLYITLNRQMHLHNEYEVFFSFLSWFPVTYLKLKICSTQKEEGMFFHLWRKVDASMSGLVFYFSFWLPMAAEGFKTVS